MGGGGSKSPPKPATVVEEQYPKGITPLTNLSLAPGTTSACNGCALGIDARASTSGVRLTRDFGDTTKAECDLYESDLKAVRANEMSFSDFLGKLQSGLYSRYAAQTANGQFCEQIQFPDDVVTKISSLSDFDANVGKLKSVRIRKVSGGGGYSSATKAKIKLSIPIKIVYADGSRMGTPVKQEMKQEGGIWAWVSTPQPPQMIPNYVTANVSTMTLYHPSPIRIENIQHDAVLSLNDPSDPTANVIILIPLKSSNTTNESTLFLSKIVRYISSISSPNPNTGLYEELDVPTGNEWNIKNVFWLGATGSDNVSPVTDAFYTWKGASTYVRYKKSESPTEIRFGWKPDGKQVRYYMLETPVSISASDLSILTRSLPPTPPKDAIHAIPDPTITRQKVLYKSATGAAASAGCGVVRERMANQGPGDVISSVFSGEGVPEMLVDETGTPLSDKASCDPFANNAKKLTKSPSPFTPAKVLTYFFNFMIIVALAIGTWMALYFVARKDYDYMYRDFSRDAGRVIGKIAMQANTNIKASTFAVGQSLAGLGSLASLAKSAKTGGPAAVQGAAPAATQ